jgi:hypothetical protein
VDAKTVTCSSLEIFIKWISAIIYEGMKKVMLTGNFLYGSLIKDVYPQGKVLGHKYKAAEDLPIPSSCIP